LNFRLSLLRKEEEAGLALDKLFIVFNGRLVDLAIVKQRLGNTDEYVTLDIITERII